MSLPTVLVADDSKTVRMLVGKALKDAGYAVLEAGDGEEALELVRNHDVSLAVLDIQMPGLDGYGVCEQLKGMGPPRDTIPIVFLTNSSCHALKMLGEQLGAYLHKPVAIEQLLAAVTSLLGSEG